MRFETEDAAERRFYIFEFEAITVFMFKILIRCFCLADTLD